MFTKFSTLSMPTMMGRRGWEYRSIANTLALLHTLAVFISFSFASVILYNNLLSRLNHSNYKQIRVELASVRTMLQAPNGRELLYREIKSQSFDTASHKFFIRVIEQDGRIINESGGMHDSLPRLVFPLSNANPLMQKYRAPSGNLFLLSSADFLDYNNAGNGQIQIAVDISEDERLAKEFMITLIMFSLLGLIFAIFSAFYIIRIGLKPLNEISEKVKNVTENNLDMRLDVALLPEEMKSLGHSFNTMFSRMENSFGKLTQYSENLAHELRTPLNNLTLEACITLSKQRTSEEYQKVINSSLEEYDRLSLLIDRLLFLARADNNQHRLAIEKIEVLQEFENIVEFHSEELIDRGVTATIVGAATLEADKVLFSRAVNNLFANSLKYTECGGSITLTVFKNDSSVDVSVSDTGIGIDPVILPKISDRYFWIESARKKDPKGTGLGLDIVKSIMKMHGGSVEIMSELGKGTTVKLQFPTTTSL